MALLVDAILAVIQAEYRLPPPQWTDVSGGLTAKERAQLEKECTAASEFDPENTRLQLWKSWNAGTYEAVYRRCPYGRVFAILDRGMTANDIPWELWGRILRLYDGLRGNKAYCIYLFAIHRPRIFPRSAKTPITPLHINGGYTYPCQTDMILIYRAEDATRVLLHELQHAECLDHPEQGVDVVEAETEAWAELWYVALHSRGQHRRFCEGIRRQSAWMQSQNAAVRRWIGKGHAFPWRYTIGKEDVWRRWGILLSEENSLMMPEAQRSLRLTAPPEGHLVHGIE